MSLVGKKVGYRVGTTSDNAEISYGIVVDKYVGALGGAFGSKFSVEHYLVDAGNNDVKSVLCSDICCIVAEDNVIENTSAKFTYKQLEEMALEMIFQMCNGYKVPEDMRDPNQGDSHYQIAMYYLNKVNKREK